MKNIIQLPFLLLLLLFSCQEKKDEPAPVPDEEKIKGEWVRQAEKTEYFNATNQKMFEINTPSATSWVYNYSGIDLKITADGVYKM